MEIELGLKITHTRDDATCSTEFRFAKDHTGPLFFSRETATMFILIAYLRGFKRENIEIKISEDGKKLTIGGKRPVQEISLRGWIMHKTDVEIREFRKVFLIPDGVNLNRIKAKFNNEESTLRITMPKFVKGVCGIEIQEVTEEHKERPEAAPPVDDLAHEIEQREPKIQRAEDTDQVEHREYRCEPEISEGMVDQSSLKDREPLEEGVEPTIERKGKIDNVVEKAVDALQFGKDNQVEQGEVSGCEPMTPAVVDKSLQKDGISMEEVEAPMMKKDETDHVVDQAFDAFQGDKQNHLEQDEFQGDKQEQAEQTFDEFQSDKQDQMDQRDVNRGEPEAPPVIIDETSQKGGKSAESVMESKMDEAGEVQQREISRRELEIPQAMIDETTQKEVKSLEEDAESMMPSKVDQLVEKLQHDKADQVQPKELSGYEPEISESMVDQSSLKGGESFEEGAESRNEQKEKINDAAEKAVDTLQFEKGNQVEQGEISGCEPSTPATVDNSSQKDGTLMEEVEALMMSKKEKIDHVGDQAFDEFQGNNQNQLEQDEFQGDKQDQVEQAFDQSQSDKQEQLDQRDITRGKPEAPPVVTDETSQKGGISLKEGAESVMENKMYQMVEQRHDEADQVQQREVSRHEPEIPQPMLDETTQKEVKSLKEDAESMMPSKVDQLVDKPQHDKADKTQPSEVSRYEPELPQVIFDETLEKDIGEAQPDKVQKVQQTEVSRCELEIPEVMIDETPQKEAKPQEECVESMMKRKEKIDWVGDHSFGEQKSDKVDHSEQAEVSKYGPEVPQVMVDETSQKKEKTQEESAEAMTEGEEEKMDQVVEQVVDERQSDEVDHMEKRKVSRLEPKMPAVAVNETSPEDGKSLEEAAEAITKSKEKISQVVEQVFDEPQRDKTEHEKQRAVSRCEPQMQIDDTSEKDGKGAESLMEFVEQVVDEPRSGADKANQVKKREVSRFEPEISDAIVDETSQKGGKSLEEEEEGAESMMKSKEKIDQVAEKAVEHGKAEFVDEVCPEMESRRLIPEKKSKEPENKESKKAIEEKLIEAELKDMQAVASTQLEEATSEKKESPASFRETTSRESLETHRDGQQEVNNLEPEVAFDTVDEAFEKDKEFPEETTRKKPEKEEIIEAVMEGSQLKEVEMPEVLPELDNNKLIPKEKSKKQKTEEKERGPEMAGEEKRDQEPMEMQSANEMVPRTIVSSQLGEATPEKSESPTTYPEIPAPEIEPLKTDHEVKKTVDDAAPRKDETFEENEKAKIERHGVHDSNELQLNEVESTVDVSPEMGASKVVSEEIYEKPKTEVKEETEKAGEEKHDQADVKEMEDMTELVPQNVVPKELEDFTHKKGHPEITMEFHEENEVSQWEPEVARNAADDEPKKDKELVEEAAKSKISSEEEALVAEISPETDAKELMQGREPEKQKLETRKVTEKAAEEKLDGGESREVPQITKFTLLEEAIPKKKDPISASIAVPEIALKSEPSETYPSGEKDVSKCETETAKVAFSEATRRDEQSIKETTEPKFDGSEGTDRAMRAVINEWQPNEVEEIAQVSPKDENKLIPGEKYEKPKNLRKDEPEKLVGEKLHERELKEMEEPAQIVPQSTVSMQVVKISPEGDKHPVSSASYPETAIPHVETPKTQHVEKKDVSKWKPDVKKVLVDEQPEKDKESVDETKTKGKKDIDQVEHQRQLIGTDRAAKISGEMDGSGLVIEEELEKPKLEMKEETEKAVEEKLDEEGPKRDMMPKTIASLQPEEDIHKKTELPSTSALHPKMTSDSGTSEFQHDGEKEATEQQPGPAKNVVEEVPKKEEGTVQEIAKPNIKIEEESDQAMQHVVKEVPKKEDMLQEIAKPKIKLEEESDKAIQSVTDGPSVNEIGGATAVSPGTDHRKLLLEENFGKPQLEIKEETGKMEEKVDEGESKAMEEATGVVPEIITGVKLEESDPAKKEYPITSTSYQVPPRSGPESSDTQLEWQTEISKWEPESVQSAVDKVLQKDNLPPEQSADSQIKRENETNQVAEGVVEDSSKMNSGQPTPEEKSRISKIEAVEETKQTVEENVDEGDSKTVEQEVLATEAGVDVSPTMESKETTPKGEYFEGPKGSHFGEKKVHEQELELVKFPVGDSLKTDEGLAEKDAKLEMQSKDEIDQVKEMVKVSLETDISKLAPEKIDEDPKMKMKEETGKLADKNVDEGELKSEKDAAKAVPQIIETVKEEEATHEKEEHLATPAFCPTTPTSESTTSESHQAKKKKVSEWELGKTTVVAEEISEKDDESVKSGIKEQKESDHIKEHSRDDDELTSEEKSEKSEIKTREETKGAVKEKVDEKVSEDIKDASEVAPQAVVSLKLEEATHQKEEPHGSLDSYPETTEKPEAPETQLVSKEVSEWEPRTTEAIAEQTPKTYEQLSEEETKPGRAVDERKFKDLAEAVEGSPEMDGIKPMVEGKTRDSETEITEATTEKATEKKAGETEIKEIYGFTGAVPQTIESTKLDGVTLVERKPLASTSYSEKKVLDSEVSENDQFGKQEASKLEPTKTEEIVDVASDEEKRSLEEAEKLKIDSKEERDHVVGQAAVELSFGVEEVPEVSPSMDSSKMVPEEKFERPDIGIKEDMEKEMKEKLDGGGEFRELQVLTQLVPEYPAEEKPPFRKITETFGVKPEKKTEEPQKKERRADQKSQTEELLNLEEHEMQVTSAERSLLDEEAKPPKGVDLADVTDQVTQQPEEPNVTETQADRAHIASKPTKGLTLPEAEKQEHDTSVEGIMRHQPEKGKEQVEAPVLTGEPQKDVSRGHDEDHGVADEYTSEKQEAIIEVPMKPDKGKEQIETPHRVAQLQENGDYQQDEDNGIEADKLPPGTSVQGPVKPETDQEKEQVEAPILPYELPQDNDHAQDEDHRKRKQTPPEKWERGLSFEGLMKPLPDQERKHVETPLLADEQKSIRDHILDEDHGLEKEIESEKKKPDISFEKPMKHEPDQEKKQVETPFLADELPRDGDRGSETTPEKREPGMSFEGQIKPVPDKERVQVETPLLGDELQNDRGRGQGKETEFEKKEPELSIEGRMTPEPDQKIQQVETPVVADEAKKNGDRGEDEVHGLQREIESGKIEPQVILEGPVKPETDKEKEQVETPLLADKQEEGDGHGKALVHEQGKEIEELNDEVKLPEKKEIEEHEHSETEIQKNFRIEEITRKMDTVPIKCKLRSLLIFAGSTFLLPLIVIVMKKSLIKFKSKKR